ncbi:hypothetical protein NDU88_011485 [Pleurodeles waltl]|uniref:Uncharacterized protein n=1 Tax=Pleurodeles waltl TaxID=8319 RepID=A0AAV7QZ95_PLEWA|nr:hypothetical protein NDU88_011485 [Pleurodeles waltl]
MLSSQNTQCDRPTLSSDRPYPWGTGRTALPDLEVLGQEPILRNFRVTAGRKGTLWSDLREQEEEPEKNLTTREQKTTSGAEKEAVTDLQTARELEDIGTTSGNPREGRIRRQYPKTPATLWEEHGLRSIEFSVDEAAKAVNSSPVHKAPGPDGVPMDIDKFEVALWAAFITNCVNVTCKSGIP